MCLLESCDYLTFIIFTWCALIIFNRETFRRIDIDKVLCVLFILVTFQIVLLLLLFVIHVGQFGAH